MPLPPKPPGSSDRRQHPRLELFAQVQVSREADVHVMSTLNVSLGGFFALAVPVDAPELKVGIEVEAVLFAADGNGGDVEAKARIVRVEDGKIGGRDAGFGLRFTQISRENRKRLESLLGRQ